jgi:predicted acylesterase/phospholipase RssA
MTKVAVTSTSGTGQTPLIITNYGRQDDTRLNYRIDFSRGSHLGLKVWEAASATSAAPSIFKPFKHPKADRTYMDGALYNNNPIRVAHAERRLLWSDVAYKHPDIILSIGTGQNLSETEFELSNGTRSMTEPEKRKTATARGKADEKMKQSLPRRQRFFRTAENVKNFFSVLVSEIKTTLFYSCTTTRDSGDWICGAHQHLFPVSVLSKLLSDSIMTEYVP